MKTKTAVSFANTFITKTETGILSKAVSKSKVWKRYIDDVVSLWDISKPNIATFIEQANLHHPTILERRALPWPPNKVFYKLSANQGVRI